MSNTKSIPVVIIGPEGNRFEFESVRAAIAALHVSGTIPGISDEDAMDLCKGLANAEAKAPATVSVLEATYGNVIPLDELRARQEAALKGKPKAEDPKPKLTAVGAASVEAINLMIKQLEAAKEAIHGIEADGLKLGVKEADIEMGVMAALDIAMPKVISMTKALNFTIQLIKH